MSARQTLKGTPWTVVDAIAERVDVNDIEGAQSILDDAKAEAYDEAVAMCCQFLGVPNVNWPNPYRTQTEE